MKIYLWSALLALGAVSSSYGIIGRALDTASAAVRGAKETVSDTVHAAFGRRHVRRHIIVDEPIAGEPIVDKPLVEEAAQTTKKSFAESRSKRGPRYQKR